MSLIEVEQCNRMMVRAIVALQEAEVDSLCERTATPYKVPSPAQLRSKFRGETGGLTSHLVERLRKDFLTLIKNLNKVKNYDEAEKVKVAVFRWRDHYEDIISQIGPEIDGLLRLSQSRLREPGDPRVDEGWAKEYRDNQSPIWLFRSAMWDFPLERVRKPKPWAMNPYTKEDLFADYQKKYKTWERRVRKKSQAAWKWLRDLVKWTESTSYWGGGGKPLPVRYPGGDVKLQSMEGFSVQLRGYDPTDETRMSEKWMGQFERGLKHYKQRASRVFPWLLTYKLPLVLHFVENKRLMGNQSAAATYSGDHINVNIFGMTGTPSEVAKVLAHEMGHHLYQNLLSQQMRDDWKQLVTGEQVDLDLRKVVAMQREKGGDLESDDSFEKRLKRDDPVMALQLRTLLHDPRYKDLDLWALFKIREYLQRGGDPIVRVPAKPITGYAAKNTEEAFCEAIGLLVGFGPRALLPEYRAALKILFPKLKVESKGTLSDALQEAITERSERSRGKVRASKLQYVHFTDAKGALGMVKQKKIWQSDYAGPAVYAVAVGGSYSPGVQLSKLGRAPKGRDVAILFTTDEFPDVLHPEEVLWHKREIRVKTAKIIPTVRAIGLLDGSRVENDELIGIPAHPSTQDWETGRVRSPEHKPVGRVF